MPKTLHISLEQINRQSAKLRYFFDNPNAYQERDLKLESIQELIEAAESDYYTVSAADFVRTGRQLYFWLDSADRFLASAIKECRGTAELLVLAISTAGRLAHLPWELLHDEAGFFVQQKNPAIVPVRWRNQKSAAKTPANRALRGLFMATSPLNVKPVLDFEQEEGLILEATARQPLTLTVEESGDLEELENLVDSYQAGYFDLFHLTGHATLTGDGARFLTETETGQAFYATAQDIAQALSRMPRLVFLSGCRTGEAGQAGGVPSLAEGLLELGAQAVLGWGRPVLDRDASQAAAALYQALAKGYDLPGAAAKTYQALLEIEAPDWHLLRLYVAGDIPGPLVTPLRTPGRRPAPPPSVATRFLDEQQRVKVPTRQSFVGRRRPLQRCLQALRYNNNLVGVLLHGMGGQGKSSLAARLCDRLPDYRRLVWVGQVDEHALANRLADDLPHQFLRETLLDPQEPLKYKLRTVFSQLEKPLLLVLDDFEANFEQQDEQPLLRDGLPVLSPAAKKVIEALSFAISKTNGQHRLIVTSRYKPAVAEAAYLHHEHLPRLPEADVRKKVARLEREKEQFTPPADLKSQAIAVADGNPRLLEWLFEILAQKGLDQALILARMADKEIEFRADILASELLNQQAPPLRQMLALALVYHLPVPKAALAAICHQVPDLDQHLNRAAALGLLEITPHRPAEVYRAPRILAPLLEEELPAADQAALARLAAQTLYQLWRQEAETSTEEQGLEIYRLARAGQAVEMAIEMAGVLTNQWHNHSRFREAEELCQKTLEIAPADYRMLHNLARAEEILGHAGPALEHYQQALQDCPAEEEREKAAIMHNLAGLFTTYGKVDEALALYRQSLEIEESIGDVKMKGATLAWIAKIYADQGQIDEALALYRQSLEITESTGDVKGKSSILRLMAIIYTNKGQIDEALALYQQTLEITESIGDAGGKAATLHQMAGIYAKQGQIDEALALYRQSLETHESTGYAQGKATTWHNMAGIYTNQGQIDEALSLYRQSLEIQESIGYARGKAATLHQMAGIYAKQGQIDEALALYRQSLEIKESIGDVQGKAVTLANMGRLLALKQGDFETALAYLEESAAILERLKSPDVETVREMMGKVRGMAGR